eukprot:TRINITY_DN11920_c0_g1_i1.p1 TRINITY_DN11920_c0_g1~~TRINITY_DN11920_c0_g1_i1.p1  ORF type:complete len:101 (+),score=28.51 TRINITY_DN11920_c0_g1_i1:35-337(+)
MSQNINTRVYHFRGGAPPHRGFHLGLSSDAIAFDDISELEVKVQASHGNHLSTRDMYLVSSEAPAEPRLSDLATDSFTLESSLEGKDLVVAVGMQPGMCD